MSEGGRDEDLLADLRRAAEEIYGYYGELDGQSHRASAILAVAQIEKELEELIRSKFHGVSNKVWKGIAGPGFTPLGSFKAKNDVAHAFGIYGPKTRCTLETLAVIRNKFAHEIPIRQFDHPIIVREFKRLAGNPIEPFVWTETMDAAKIRETFLNLALMMQKRLLEVRATLLELEDPPPVPLP